MGVTLKWGGSKRWGAGRGKRQSETKRRFGRRRQRLVAERCQCHVSRAHAAAAAVGHGAHRGMTGGVLVAFAHAGRRRARAGVARRGVLEPSHRGREEKKHR